MAQTVLYIALSLDGYIAREDGSLDWLQSIPPPVTGDYGYQKLLNSIGTIIMGAQNLRRSNWF
jgi:dihydrofolate reductase